MPIVAPLAAVGSFIGAHAATAAVVGSTLLGAKMSSDASKKAAAGQVGAANNAVQLQADMFNQIRDDLSPYRDFGGTALTPLAGLLGTGGNTAATPNWDAYLKANPDVLAEAVKQGVDPKTFAAQHYKDFGQKEGRALPMTPGVRASDTMQRTLEQIPGYKFVRDQGIKGVTNSFGGRGLSGPQAKGVARFVTGLADTTYGDQITRLMNAATMGQNAANQTGGFGSAAATNSGNALIGAGNAAAAGTIGSANALSGGIYNAGQAYLTNKLLGGGGSAAAFGTQLAKSGNYYGGSYGGGEVPY